jgi:hypothetical protein
VTAKGKYKYISLSESLLTRMTDTMVLLDQMLLDNMREQHNKEREELKVNYCKKMFLYFCRMKLERKKKIRESSEMSTQKLKKG